MVGGILVRRREGKNTKEGEYQAQKCGGTGGCVDLEGGGSSESGGGVGLIMGREERSGGGGKIGRRRRRREG